MPNNRAAMVVRGTFIHTPVCGEVDIIEDAAVAVDDDDKYRLSKYQDRSSINIYFTPPKPTATW